MDILFGLINFVRGGFSNLIDTDTQDEHASEANGMPLGHGASKCQPGLSGETAANKLLADGSLPT